MKLEHMHIYRNYAELERDYNAMFKTPLKKNRRGHHRHETRDWVHFFIVAHRPEAILGYRPTKLSVNGTFCPRVQRQIDLIKYWTTYEENV